MLAGIRIVEFEGLGPAPFAAMMLADLGAEVICVHRPDTSDVTGAVSLLDRGKKSITLDLKSDADRTVALALIQTADALIEGLRPGVMERLGLGPEICQTTNPALVYGRMTGWGQDGPRAQTAGHDLNYLATSGALWYASEPGQPPFTPPTMLGDIGGGALYLVAGILTGLLAVRGGAKGAVVDAAMVDGSAHMMTLLMAIRQSGQMVTDRGQSLLDGPHWSRCYACADGGYLSVQCLEPQFYAAFLKLLGLGDNPALADQHDPAQWPRQTAQLAGIFVAEPVAHWAALFDGSDACVAPVLSPDGAAHDPHMQARGIWQAPDGVLQPSAAPRFDGLRRDVARPPLRGAQSDEIRADLIARGLLKEA
ncbi:CoA transferase [Pseudohalocynthiibacter aestuariivivens]|uniref:CoA transferase n=1 Tax=Roseovarius pelagicus TaxID=2980108 RepID=A0ABY6D8G8_9RHOB|nr:MULTISPECIES: CaiB/BaiF CoA-transferase family protein [Rhodobacterales]QIE45660.1 CoA transferase [Pseudohalocynthiibacter aestuariivivens]UXX82424.1 CoA transferase [Roseovarius pelagicus]